MKNPVVPYILILAFGVGLIFFMSLYGVGEKEQIASEGETPTEETAGGDTAASDFDGATEAQACIACHGGNLEGGMGPALAGTDLSKEEIVDVLKNGRGAMPAFPNLNQEAMADYILSLQ